MRERRDAPMISKEQDALGATLDPSVDRLRSLVGASSRRVIMPIGVYPGLGLTGGTVRDLVTDAGAQFEAAVALHERYGTPVIMSAMDLSVEAEAFGAEVHFSEHEVPTVTCPVLSSASEAKGLSMPAPGDKRTVVYLETVRKLKLMPGNPVVLGGCIGPFSLAGRLVGIAESFGLTIEDPELMHELVGKCAQFLEGYVRAFRSVGADGVIMAEPSAGLLSPSAVATFSSPYVRRIVESVGDSPFSFVLHNCAARPVHLPAMIGAGARILHFGAPMDLATALRQVDRELVLCGNLDPAGVFCQGSPEVVAEQTVKLLASTAGFANHVLSSGCDLPPEVSLANLDAFYSAAEGMN
jgi:uroporphyrinogen decarboxylase